MTTVVRRKRSIEPEPRPEDWEGDVSNLIGHEGELTEDHDLCERVFGSAGHSSPDGG